MAAVTALSTLGGRVCMDSRGEELIISRKADGTLQPGWAADISAETAVGVNPTGDFDEFGGFCLPRYDTDIDTAFTITNLIDIVIPQGGHLYNVYIKDPNAVDYYPGEPLVFIAGTAGAMDGSQDIELEHQARIFDAVLDTSTYATIIWGV